MHTSSIIGLIPELPESLTVAGGEPPTELHVTLVYLTDDHTTLTPKHRAAIGDVLRTLATPITAPIVGVRSLGDDDPPATVLLLDSPELQELRPAMKAALTAAGVPVPEDRFPSYLPHLTVGYGTSLDDAAALVGQDIRLNTLAAFYGPERDTVTAEPPTPPEAASPQKEAPMDAWSAVLARLGTPTGDGRIIAPDALTHRTLPLPLMWQRETSGGHDGAVVVGRIDTIDIDPSGLVLGHGALLNVAEAYEVRELITNGVIGPSVDLDDTTSVIDEDDRIIITEGRISGATLVPIPAFAEVSISMDGPPLEGAELEGVDIDEEYAALVAAASPAREQLPPAGWFMAPRFSELTPLTVNANGRVFGHIAPWDQCYVGLPGCRTAPRSPSGYAYFLLHAQPVAEGYTVPVGVLSVGEGHAGLKERPAAAMRHYEDVATVAARVNVGEDEFGIWCAGALVPGIEPTLLDRFVSSPLSGDWRPIGGGLELIAACSVNTPGFPIPRTRATAAFSGGEPIALVAPLATPLRGVDEPTPAASVDSLAVITQARARWAWAQSKGKVAA